MTAVAAFAICGRTAEPYYGEGWLRRRHHHKGTRCVDAPDLTFPAEQLPAFEPPQPPAWLLRPTPDPALVEVRRA